MSMHHAAREPIPLRAHRHRVSAAADVATQQQRYTPDAQAIPSHHESTTEELPGTGKRPWLGPVLAGMLAMALLAWIATAVVLPFVTDQIDHWNTGAARISQYDYDVGHGGTSHFLTEYYQNRVLVLETLRNDPTTVHTYVVPFQFTIPPPIPPIITLQARDLNGDGKLDLLVWIEGVSNPVPLYNNGQTFQIDDPTRKG